MTTKNHDTATAAKQKTVSITREFNLPLNTVWKAWTEPSSFKMWWGPEGFTCPFCTIDLKAGGKSLACMKSAEGKEYWSTATYREIIPMKKLVYEDNFSDDKGNTVSPSYYDMPGEWSNVIVTVTLEEKNGKTKMTMEQQGIPEEMYNDCITGWQQCFDKMEKNLK
jgi:uncharacterized protein YndB with AHSA1/START domain